jgi:serine/threonine protein kinase
MGCNFSIMKSGIDKGKFYYYIESRISISGYKLEKVIGKGGFSKVWKATEKSTKEKVAIKVMSKAKIYDRNSIQSILNEMDLVKKIRHPYPYFNFRFILSIKAAFQDKENLYLVMDYLTGGDIRYHMQSKVKFNESQASKQ